MIKTAKERADQHSVRVSVGLLSLVIGLAATGFLFRAQLQMSGPDHASATKAIQSARDVATRAELQRAEISLEQYHAQFGTYGGAVLLAHARLVRADASSYCVEAGGLHLAGPNASPAPGPCR